MKYSIFRCLITIIALTSILFSCVRIPDAGEFGKPQITSSSDTFVTSAVLRCQISGTSSIPNDVNFIVSETSEMKRSSKYTSKAATVAGSVQYSVALSGLTAGSTYFYYVEVKYAQVVVKSEIYSFTIKNMDDE